VLNTNEVYHFWRVFVKGIKLIQAKYSHHEAKSRQQIPLRQADSVGRTALPRNKMLTLGFSWISKMKW
jgi:hypothetical protein